MLKKGLIVFLPDLSALLLTLSMTDGFGVIPVSRE